MSQWSLNVMRKGKNQVGTAALLDYIKEQQMVWWCN